MASIVTQSVQNGSKRGSQNGSPRSRNQKKVKKNIIWPQSTKKVTHVPVFEEKNIFEKKNEKKNLRPTGGCSGPGGLQGGVVVGGLLQGGVGPEKKSSQKNLKSESPPKKVPEKKSKKKI